MFHIGYTVNPPCRTQVAESRESLYYAKAEFLFMRVDYGFGDGDTFRRLIFRPVAYFFTTINISII